MHCSWIRKALLPFVAAAAFAPAGVFIGQAAQASDDPAGSAPAVAAQAEQVPASKELSDPIPTAWISMDAELKAEPTVALSECPEALAFFERPDVKAFHDAHLGGVFAPDTLLSGGCPSTELLANGYKQGQELAAKGLMK